MRDILFVLILTFLESAQSLPERKDGGIMLEYQGEYGKAKVMIDSIDETTVKQIYEFLNHEAFTNPIAIMPDTHAGAGAVIGFTMEMTDKVIPNVIGVDIGCGMYSAEFPSNFLDSINIPDLDDKIRNSIPLGTNVHQDIRLNIQSHNPFWKEINYSVNNMSYYFHKRFPESGIGMPKNIDHKWFEKKCDEIGMDYDRAIRSCGTLGSGNHFIEIGQAEMDRHIWITVHSGSRQFGYKIAQYHQKIAKKIGTKWAGTQLAYLEGQEMFDYLIDMVVAQQYARENRSIMQWLIHLQTAKEPIAEIDTIHNYIDFEDFIIRKGAIASYKKKAMIIPLNMEEGILLCEGKSNKEWNYSAPHGAGRLGSRRWAKDTLSIEDAEKRMKDKGIYCSKLPLDETARAYKDPKIIEDSLEPTAWIIDKIKPILVIKD